MKSPLVASTTGERPLRQPSDAYSAIHTTSIPSTSHSLDFARRRWTCWARASSAASGNSRSLTVTPLPWALNLLIDSAIEPVVSLATQNVTFPLASLAWSAVRTSAFGVPVPDAPSLLDPHAAAPSVRAQRIAAPKAPVGVFI